MNLKRVFEILKAEGYPLGCIRFKAKNMRGWYRPLSFSHGQLHCLNMDSKTDFLWNFGRPGNIDTALEVSKVSVDKIPDAVVGASRVIVSLHLKRVGE